MLCTQIHLCPNPNPNWSRTGPVVLAMKSSEIYTDTSDIDDYAIRDVLYKEEPDKEANESRYAISWISLCPNGSTHGRPEGQKIDISAQQTGDQAQTNPNC